MARPDVERLERFDSLAPGTYWRAVRPGKAEGIIKGQVLLLEKIKYVDGRAHTALVRRHPDWIASNPRHDATHAFVVDDFLERFEFEPDHARIRAAEMDAVRRRAAAMGEDLSRAQSDPTWMRAWTQERVAAERKRRLERADPAERKRLRAQFAQLDMADASLAAISAPDAPTAVAAGMAAEHIERLKVSAERRHEIAAAQAAVLTEKAQEMASVLQGLAPYAQEQAAAAIAAVSDVRDKADRMRRGLATLDLYIGKDVEVERIAEGEPAAASEPLSICQRKLFADEELSVFVDVDQEDFDVRDDARFVEALATEPNFVSQIFPAPRCIVSVALRRQMKEYGDPHRNAIEDGPNRAVFLLVRDGGNIWRVWSPLESHLGAERLFPRGDEIDKVYVKKGGLFEGIDGTRIRFDDPAFADYHRAADDLALHYKRFLVLLAGLDHRLRLFGEFYPSWPAGDFMSLSFQRRHLRLVRDDDPAHSLGREARPAFSEWIASHNAGLRSGSRVFCRWRSLLTPDTAPSLTQVMRGGNRYSLECRPAQETSVTVARREDGGLVVDCRVTKETRTGAERTFDARVALQRFSREWGDGFAYLVLDRVRPEDLRWYIGDRESRKRHGEWIILFKRALKLLESEAVAEAPSRDVLKTSAREGRLSDAARVEEAVAEAIAVWRAAHRGAPLPDLRVDRTAREALLAQVWSRLGGSSSDVDEAERLAKRHGLSPLRLMIGQDGHPVLFAEPTPEETDSRLEPERWVRRLRLHRGRKGLRIEGDRRDLLRQEPPDGTVIHDWPTASAWFVDPAKLPLQTPQERTSLLGWIADQLPQVDLLRPGRKLTVDEFEYLFEQVKLVERKIARRTLVVEADIAVPIGVAVERSRWSSTGFLRLLCLSPDGVAPFFLRDRAPDDKASARVEDWYASRYAKKDAALERMRARRGPVGLVLVPLSMQRHLPFVSANLAKGRADWLDGPPKHAKGFDAQIRKWVLERPGRAFVLAPGINLIDALFAKR